MTGLPTAIEVSISELREALAGSVSIIVDTIRDALDETPPELISDLMESGICMTGGGSQLKGLAERVQEEVKVRAWVVEDALTCVARGIGEILEDYSNFRNYLVTMEHGSEGHPQ